jgi:hypothetical protein
MRQVRLAVAALVVGMVLTPWATAQPPQPKPGPEHDMLKTLVGTWDATVKYGDQESKGTMVYKLELGGMWLVGNYEGEFGGTKFQGKSLDTYDPLKKKYVNIWVDSMSARHMTFEGTFDKDKGMLTMFGEGIGMDGKPVKYKEVTHYKDNDTMVFTMSTVGDGDNPQLTITYKRRK